MISFSPASRRPSSTPCPRPSSASCLASRCSIPSPRPPSGSEGAPAAGAAPRGAAPPPAPLRPAGKRNAASRGAPPSRPLAPGPGPRRDGRGAPAPAPPARGRYGTMLTWFTCRAVSIRLLALWFLFVFLPIFLKFLSLPVFFFRFLINGNHDDSGRFVGAGRWERESFS